MLCIFIPVILGIKGTVLINQKLIPQKMGDFFVSGF